jgi:hypothetical protein
MTKKDIVLAYLENIQLEATLDYVQRGRSLAQVDIDELKRRWVVEFKGWVANLETGNKLDPRPREDIESEMKVRGTEPPWDLVSDDFEAMRKASRAYQARLAQNPAKLAQQERRISEDVEAFRRSIEDSKPN